MLNVATAVMESVGGEQIALESVDVKATLQGLFSEVTMTQVYRNLESVNIEAVYTFPLPLDAVLLELTLELNGETLTGVVQPRAEAAEVYEEAMEEGDTAVLLEKSGPGLFTVNLGNLQAGERALVRFRFSQLHRWQGDTLRFQLPTTIAPRYGDPSAVGMQPHQIPEYCLNADHGFSLQLQVLGDLSRAVYECPTHRVSVVDTQESRSFTLNGGSAQMDRDFVLMLREPEGQGGETLVVPDGDQHLVLASFHPHLPAGEQSPPRCIKLVIDCSGSMSGDSIAQARAALHEILALLEPGDWFNIVAFGSNYRMLSEQLLPVSENSLAMAARFVAELDADMGGTEINRALIAAYDSGVREGLSQDLLLITDGEVWQHDAVVKAAHRSRHRIFTVGVGSAVSEAFLRQLAEQTGGACELVSPHEGMAEHIVRHFKRIDQPSAAAVKVVWPDTPVRQFPREIGQVFAGDTLHLFAWFDEPPTGETMLVIDVDDGQTLRQRLRITGANEADEAIRAALPRVAANARIDPDLPEESKELAVSYQLVTEQTSCVLVYQREIEQKADGVPVLRKVPQMLAAGWGGMGTMDACMEDLAEPVHKAPARRMESRIGMRDLKSCSYSRRSSIVRSEKMPPLSGNLIDNLNQLFDENSAGSFNLSTVAELRKEGLGRIPADVLDQLVDKGMDERSVVIAYLQLLLVARRGMAASRHLQRLVRRAAKQWPVTSDVLDAVRDVAALG